VRAVLIFIQHVETYYNGATTFAFMLLCHSPLKLTRLVFVCNSHFVAYRREVFITPMSGWLQQSSLIQLVLIIAVYLLRYVTVDSFYCYQFISSMSFQPGVEMETGFYRATRMHRADYAVARCLSVCLSVCHTQVFCLNGYVYPQSFFTTG